jgi:hypothetical protein
VTPKARLLGKVEGTGSWDNYREVSIGTISLEKGTQRCAFYSQGTLAGYLLDLRGLTLKPVAGGD